MPNCSLNHARSGPHSCSASTAPLVGSISPPPIALWLALIFILLHGPQAHVNSCGHRPVRPILRNSLRESASIDRGTASVIISLNGRSRRLGSSARGAVVPTYRHAS